MAPGEESVPGGARGSGTLRAPIPPGRSPPPGGMLRDDTRAHIGPQEGTSLSRFKSIWVSPYFRSILLLLVCLLVALGSSCASDVDVEKIFVQANSDDYDERTEARAKLMELVQKGRVEPFARGLRSKNAETRVQSMLHLMAIQKPEATDALVGELELTHKGVGGLRLLGRPERKRTRRNPRPRH